MMLYVNNIDGLDCLSGLTPFGNCYFPTHVGYIRNVETPKVPFCEHDHRANTDRHILVIIV